MQHLTAFNSGEKDKQFRDKVAKTLQYGAKIVAEVATDPNTKKSFSTLASNLSMGRRIYRWGQVTNSIESIIKILLDPNPHAYLKKLAIYLAYFLSQTFDMLCYIHMLRFNQPAVERSTWYTQFFYFVVCVLEFLEQLQPIFQNLGRLSAKRAEERKHAQAAVLEGVLNAVKRVGDGVTALRDVVPEPFENHRVGVAASGFTSGFIALYQAIPALYK